jgi:tetratricopeptide (TPR) repeat protein
VGNIAAQLKEASAFHRRADYSHSIPILRRIVQTSPGSYKANLLLGEDLYLSWNAQDALAPLQTAAESAADDGVALLYVAKAEAALGDFSSASNALQSAVTRSGGAENFQMDWGNYCIARMVYLRDSLAPTQKGKGTELRFRALGRPEGSEERASLLKESVAADPEQRGIWGELGVEQLELGNREQAQESLREAEKRDSQGSETLRLEALLAAGEQKWQEAADRLVSVGARSPVELSVMLRVWPASLVPGPDVSGVVWDCLRNPEASCPLIATQAIGGEDLSAKDLYAEGRWEQLKALPNSATMNASESLWRGVALVKTGAYAEAISLLESGMKADELVAAYWLQACYALELAQTEAKMSTEAARHRLAGTRQLRLRGDASAALAEYLKALEFRQNDPELLAEMAEAYRMEGDSKHARQTASAALEIDPREGSALTTMAQLEMNERNYAEALTCLMRLANVQPKNAWTRIQLGVTYGQIGNPAKVVKYLEPELAAGYPDEKGALHAQLARALRKLGRDAEASRAAAEAARLTNSWLQGYGQGDGDGHQ